MATLTPVNYNPFETTVPPAPPIGETGGTLTPVNYNPFENLSFEIPRLSLGQIQEPRLVSPKEERAGLIKPSSSQQRIRQAAEFIEADKIREHEQNTIKQLQAKIDRGEPTDPLQTAYYQEYLDIPEPKIPTRVLEGAIKQPKEKEVFTAQGWLPVSQVDMTKTRPPEVKEEIPIPETVGPTIQPSVSLPPELPTLESGALQIEPEGTWAGILKRPMESMGAALGQAVLSAAQGVAELGEKVPGIRFTNYLLNKLGEQFGYDFEKAQTVGKEKLSDLITDIGLYRKKISNEIRKEGGLAAETAQTIADGAAEMALTLAGAGILRPLKSASAVRQSITEAARFGTIMAAATPGTTAERIKTGISSAAYMITPLALLKLGSNPWTAVTINTLLNAGVDAVSGHWKSAMDEAVAKAEEKGEPENWMRELWTTASPMLLNEGLFGVMGATGKFSEIQKQGIKEQIDSAPPEIKASLREYVKNRIKEVSPESRKEWMGFIEKTDAEQTAAMSRGEIPFEPISTIKPITEGEPHAERTGTQIETPSGEEKLAAGEEGRLHLRNIAEDRLGAEVKPPPQGEATEVGKPAEPAVFPSKGVEKPPEMPLEPTNAREGIPELPPSEIGAEMAAGTGRKLGNIEPVVEQTVKGKMVSIPAAEVKATREGGLSGKEQKKYLIAEVDKVIEDAPDIDIGDKIRTITKGKRDETLEEYRTRVITNQKIIAENKKNIGTVIIEIPGDGTFEIYNNKTILKKFRDEMAKKFPTMSAKPVEPKLPSVKSSPIIEISERPAEQTEVKKILEPFISEDKARVDLQSPWHAGNDEIVATDGRRLAVMVDIKGKKETNKIYPAFRRAVPGYQEGKLPVKQETQTDISIKNTEQLLRQLKQAQQILPKENKFPTVKLYLLPDNTIGVTSSHPDTGEYQSVDVSKGQLLGVYSPDQLIDALSFLRKTGNKSAIWRHEDNLSSIILLGNKEYVVQMPFRLNGSMTPIRIKPNLEPIPLVKEKPVLDIEKLGKAKKAQGEAGFARIAAETPERITSKTKSFFEKAAARIKKLAVFEGAPAEMREAVNRFRSMEESTKLTGKEQFQRVNLALKSLSKTYSRETVLQDLANLTSGEKLLRARDTKGAVVMGKVENEKPDTITLRQAGDIVEYPKDELVNMTTIESPHMTLEDFAKKYKLAANSQTIKDLRNITQVASFKRAAELGQKLRETGAPEEIAEAVENNVYYTPQIYARWLLGEKFEPSPQAYRAAVLNAKADIQEVITSMTKKAGELRGVKTPVDIEKYFKTGDAKLLSDIGETRKTSIDNLRKTYLRYEDIIQNMIFDGKKYQAELRSEELESASRNYVNEYLDKVKKGMSGKGGVDVSHLVSRSLGELYQDLYKPLTKDPRVKAQMTAEVQEKMLATLDFYEKMANEWRGKYWGERYDIEKKFTQKLGNEDNSADKLRYGKMAGKYVTPELFRLLNPQRWNPAARKNLIDSILYFGVIRPQAALREMGVVWHQTIGRNEGSNFIGWSSQCGDMQLPNYMKYYWEANKHAKDYLLGKPDATAIYAEMAKYDVFSSRTTPGVEDIRRFAGEGRRTKLGEFERKVMEAYALSDGRFREAGWRARTDDILRRNPRMSLEETKQKAAERVRKVYPYAPATPPLIAGLSHWPTGDYITYQYQALRGKVNALKIGIQEAKQGDPRALRGWIETQMLESLYNTGKFGVITWAALHKIIRRDEDVVEQTPLTGDAQNALRSFQMWFDKNASQWQWKERRKNGEERIYYTVTQNQRADPTSEIIAGAIQSDWDTPEKIPLDIAKGIARGYAGGGMYAEHLYKFLMGEQPLSPYEVKGILDVAGKEDARKTEIIEKSLAELAVSVGTGRLAPFIRDYMRWKRIQKKGTAEELGDYETAKTPKEIMGSAVRMIRSKYIDKETMAFYLRNLVAQKQRGIRSAETAINEWEKNNKPDSDLDRISEYQHYRMAKLREIREILDNYKKLGVKWFSEQELFAILDDGGIKNKQMAVKIMDNNLDEIEPYARKKPYTGTSLQKVWEETEKKNNP